jgi:hypothetical protein
MLAMTQHRARSSSRRRAGGLQLLRCGSAAAAVLLAACVLLSAATCCGGTAVDELVPAARAAEAHHFGTQSTAPRRALLAHAPAPAPAGDVAERVVHQHQHQHRTGDNSTLRGTTTTTTTTTTTSTDTSSTDSTGVDPSAQSTTNTMAPQDPGSFLLSAVFIGVTSSLLVLLCLSLYPTYFFPCPTFGIGIIGFLSPFSSGGTQVIVNG